MLQNFLIPSSDIKGPLDLSLTINSGQTSQPAWKMVNGQYQDLMMIKNIPCLVKIGTVSGDDDLKVSVNSKGEISKDDLKNAISNIFSLDYDLNKLYNFIKDDPKLAHSLDFCYGLRVFKAHDPFECIISSISSANCSIIRWTRSINDIKSKWGKKFIFNSESFYTFPAAKILGNVPEHDLEEMQRGEENLPNNFKFENNLQACGVGYRAKYIIKTAKIIKGQCNLEEIYNMEYQEAFKQVLKLPGVGPKVADCILLYGFGKMEAFPVDVWIKRIMENLYFSGKEMKTKEIREFGMEHFENFAGNVQLYLFHFARKSGLLEKISMNKN